MMVKSVLQRRWWALRILYLLEKRDSLKIWSKLVTKDCLCIDNLNCFISLVLYNILRKKI